MSTQATFDLPGFFLDSFVPPEPILPAYRFSSEFLSLALLEQGNNYQEAGMPCQLDQTGTVQAVAPNMQDKDNDNTHHPRLRNHALRPAPCGSGKALMDAQVSSVTPNRLSPHSDPSDTKSLCSPYWWDTNKDKRAKHLERNRAAARKSRRKKKRETDQLQSQFQEVSRIRSRLEVEVKGLKRELLSLKDQILMHSWCNDEAIHNYP
ncbi:hypothetical protein BDV12DRAFT_202365 [Aspergillus spectabilis]